MYADRLNELHKVLKRLCHLGSTVSNPLCKSEGGSLGPCCVYVETPPTLRSFIHHFGFVGVICWEAGDLCSFKTLCGGCLAKEYDMCQQSLLCRWGGFKLQLLHGRSYHSSGSESINYMLNRIFSKCVCWMPLYSTIKHELCWLYACIMWVNMWRQVFALYPYLSLSISQIHTYTYSVTTWDTSYVNEVSST